MSATSDSSKETLTITDNRTGKQYELPIKDGTIRAMDLRQIKTDDDEDFGLMTYDPAFMNTASCKSTITYIDGDRGVLEYRGYPIEQLAEQSSYLEVAYLLLHGELPTEEQLEAVDVEHHAPHLHQREHQARCSTASTTTRTRWGCSRRWSPRSRPSTPKSKNIRDEECRRKQIHRLIAKVPTIAAFAYRHRVGLPILVPRQRPLLRGQLPQHDVQDDGAEVPAQPRA